MRNHLYLRFVITYVAFGFVSIFAILALEAGLIESPLQESIGNSQYRQASLLASDYLPKYFSEEISEADVFLQLEGMRSYYLSASVWFVDTEGNLINQSNSDDMVMAPKQISDFDPTEFGTAKYGIGNYHGLFDEDVLTIITPVVYNYVPQGYLIVHQKETDLESTMSIVSNGLQIMFLVVYILSLSIGLVVYVSFFLPLRVISQAAKRYATGDLNYEIPIASHDEFGKLAGSLNYMSSQLRDMEEYQRKFIANVSHDFRSPLTSIKGYVEAMTDGTIPPELHEKYLKIILFETERLKDLTEDLLTLNEFDTQDLILDKTDFDIHEVVRRVAAAFEGACMDKKITVELLFASRQLYVHADRRRIQQVLYNLIDNAIKFSDVNSTVTIETSNRHGKIYTSVKDTGIGIPKDSISKIWERFYKSDLSRGKDKKGTGLGLSIVKEAISAHGENINVISTEGVGTEFVFSLPVGKAPENPS